MISLLLASYLATQSWTWDKHPEPDVVLYRIYWGASGVAWCSQNRVEVPSSACGLTDCQGEVPDPGYSFYLTVAAVDSAGNESLPDHGSVVTCP
jgi:hypothetical protein